MQLRTPATGHLASGKEGRQETGLETRFTLVTVKQWIPEGPQCRKVNSRASNLLEIYVVIIHGLFKGPGRQCLVEWFISVPGG